MSGAAVPPKRLVLLALVGLLCTLVLLSTACSDPTPLRTSSPEGIAAALREPAPLVRARRLLDALESIDPSLAPEILAVYEEARVLVDPADALLFAGWWAGHDPGAAFEAFMKSNIGGGTAPAEAIIRVWMQQAPTAALVAVDGADVSEERREEFMGAVVRGWYESGREGVWEFVQSLRPGFDRQKLVASLLVRKLRDEGVEDTIAFIDAAPDTDPRFKRNLFHRAAGVIARRDLPRAVAWSDSLIDDPNGGSLGRIVGGVWVQQGDPAEAMAWLTSRPQGQWGHVAVRECYRIWLQNDREAALAWMDAAEHDAATEPALAIYAAALGRSDPQKGVAVLEKIKDTSRRERATIRLARRWYDREPTAAAEWIATLPEELALTIKQGQPVLDGPVMPM